MTGRTHWIICDAPGCGLCISTEKERPLLGYAISQGWVIVAPDMHACPEHVREVRGMEETARRDSSSHDLEAAQ